MRRFLLIALTALALGASAAPRRPAAGLGNAKDDDSEIAPPARSASGGPGCPDDDSALARALAFAFQPAPVEIRVIAVEDLALLGDPRALNPLAALIFDSQPAVQAAALRAVSQFSAPRAEEILSNVVRHPLFNDRLKTQAIEGLVFQRAPTAREMLASVADSASANPSVRNAARQALHNWGPRP